MNRLKLSNLGLNFLGARNAQTGNHLAQLLAGGNVSHPHFAQLREVEQGQALGEQFAVDDALAQARDDAEADAAGELVQSRADAAQVVRIDVLKAVAEHNPVDALARDLGALGTAVPDQFGVEAWAGDLEGLGV